MCAFDSSKVTKYQKFEYFNLTTSKLARALKLKPVQFFTVLATSQQAQTN